jgi:hypothetical protein
MSMKGSLKEIGIAEIIQFPASSRLSGRMVLERSGQRAELFYVLGELHHACLGDRVGLPVLVELLPWNRGEFEFELDVPPPERSIDMDLGKAMVRAMMAEPDPGQAPGVDPVHVKSTVGFQSLFGPGWDSATFARITTFMADHPVFFYACVVKRRGTLLAEHFRPMENLPEAAEAYLLLRDIMKHYAFTCQSRMVIDASYCTLAMRPFGEDLVLLALARPDAAETEVEAAIDGLVVKLEDPYQVP